MSEVTLYHVHDRSGDKTRVRVSRSKSLPELRQASFATRSEQMEQNCDTSWHLVADGEPVVGLATHKLKRWAGDLGYRERRADTTGRFPFLRTRCLFTN